MPSKTIKKFTDNLIKGLQPEAKRYEVSCNGLILRVYPNGTKTWCFFYRYKDKAGNRLTFGKYPLISLYDANEMLFNAQRLLAKGIDPKEHKMEAERAAAGDITVEQLYNRYMNEYVRPAHMSGKLSERYVDDQVKEITKHIVNPWANLTVKSITRQDGIQLIKDMLNRGQNKESERVRVYLNNMWNFAIDNAIVDANPLTRLKNIYADKDKVKKKDPNIIVNKSFFLNDAEIKTFWQGVDKHCTDGTGAALKLMLLLGRRGSDVRPMRKSEIDLKAKIWHMTPAKIREEKKPDYKPILMPLPKLAFDIICEQMKKATENDWMFPSLKVTHLAKHITQSALSQGIQREDYFGLPKVTPHDLRRTTSTGMARIGIEQSAIDQVLAHSMYGLAKVYNRHDYLETRQDALEKWNAHIEKLLAVT